MAQRSSQGPPTCTRQAEREELLKTLAAADVVTQLQVDRQQIERRVLGQIDQCRKMLTTDERQVLLGVDLFLD
jgi:hypothetical protein